MSEPRDERHEVLEAIVSEWRALQDGSRGNGMGIVFVSEMRNEKVLEGLCLFLDWADKSQCDHSSSPREG